MPKINTSLYLNMEKKYHRGFIIHRQKKWTDHVYIMLVYKIIYWLGMGGECKFFNNCNCICNILETWKNIDHMLQLAISFSCFISIKD